MEIQHAAGLYTITNTVSGKVYIGSTVRMSRRLAQHKTALRANEHQNSHLQYAWNKYGEAAFVFAPILVCSSAVMRFYEQRAIDTLKPEYNQSKSAYSGIPVGATLSPEHKAKVGKASAALWATPEYRQKTSIAIKASITDEERTKRKERTRKLWADPIYRQRAVAARKGNTYCKGHKCTPEQVQNRKRAARISNMKRNYGVDWKLEYAKRYPEHAGDVDAK